MLSVSLPVVIDAVRTVGLMLEGAARIQRVYMDGEIEGSGGHHHRWDVCPQSIRSSATSSAMLNTL